MASPLGDKTLGDRLQRRMSLDAALDLGEQMLEGLAYAHAHWIMHCDVKPENLILFPDNHLRLADFGIAKVALRTMEASGTGTVGYMAPEQAMGKPSFRSDVFSAGLVLYRMLSGRLPEWPFEWPPPGHARLRRRLTPAFLGFLRRAIQVDHRRRFPNAEQMLASYQKLLPGVHRRARRRRRRSATSRSTSQPDWRQIRQREFLRRHRGALKLDARCGRCKGPMAEAMRCCPWCGAARRRHRGETSFPARCSRCGRGRKLDWRFCAWCYGAGFTQVADRAYSDVRYSARCGNPGCSRKVQMPFMRYCPWCRRKVQRKWRIPGSSDRCPRCGWGVFSAYWDHCPWCEKSLERKK